MTKPDVVILCGGLGTRFQEITAAVPKPMALIGNRPFLDILLAKFAQAGFNRFILCVGHLAQVVKNHYQAYPQNVEIVFSEEQELLGTGGAVKHARLLIKSENFFVLNGDSYCETELPAFLKFHLAKPDAIASIVLANKDERADTGGIALDEFSEKITGYAEKNAENHDYINAGIYLFDQKGFDLMPPQKTFSLEYDFFPNLIGKGFYGFRTSGQIIDIGTPERYRQALDFFANNTREKNYV